MPAQCRRASAAGTPRSGPWPASEPQPDRDPVTGRGPWVLPVCDAFQPALDRPPGAAVAAVAVAEALPDPCLKRVGPAVCADQQGGSAPGASSLATQPAAVAEADRRGRGGHPGQPALLPLLHCHSLPGGPGHRRQPWTDAIGCRGVPAGSRSTAAGSAGGPCRWRRRRNWWLRRSEQLRRPDASVVQRIVPPAGPVVALRIGGERPGAGSLPDASLPYRHRCVVIKADANSAGFVQDGPEPARQMC